MTWRPDPIYARLGWAPRPTSAGLVKVELCGRFPRVAPEAVEAVEAMNAVLVAAGYENPCDWVGSYKYRNVAGTTQLSRHAYGLAIDLDYGGDTDGDGDPTIDKNPHLRRPVTPADYGVTIQLLRHQVDAVLGIRTVSGAQPWRWLGDLNGDAMHFDIQCAPADLASGILWSTEQEGDEMDLERWVTRLRIPADIDRMAEVGIITADEADYWAGRQPSMGGQPLPSNDPEWQDLRDAVEVRAVWWT